MAGDDQCRLGGDLCWLVNVHADVVRVGAEVGDLEECRSRNGAEASRCTTGTCAGATRGDGRNRGGGYDSRTRDTGQALRVIRVDHGANGARNWKFV